MRENGQRRIVVQCNVAGRDLGGVVNDIRRVVWIRHLTQNRGVNLAGVRVLFELEEKLGRRILEVLYSEDMAAQEEATRRSADPTDERRTPTSREATSTPRRLSPLKETY